jgi:hypothetical protein
MARPLRLPFPGAIYHVTSRGNSRQKVFFTDADRELFLMSAVQIVQAVQSFDTRCTLLRITGSPKKPQGCIEGRSVHAVQIEGSDQRLSVCARSATLPALALRGEEALWFLRARLHDAIELCSSAFLRTQAQTLLRRA